MAKKVGVGSVKRLGVRYGRTTRHKLAKIEKLQKKLQKCTYCLKFKAKRLSAGIYHCTVCNATFTNDAFFVGSVKRVTVEEE